MSYKSLLFCPDEATARLVTQVLSELEFTVELSFEPFVTVKKLEQEQFDALVVDCNDEQNASVLFKGARNSSLNHSSLCVAVVEGQAGLAKAFRIGANLVLTKPINIEQSKNTLRVARGLLRKNAPPSKGAAPSDSVSETKTPPPIAAQNAVSAQPATVATPHISAPAPATTAVPAAAAPWPAVSSIEVEKEKTPEPEPEDAAVLDSLPDLTISKFPAKSAATPAVGFGAGAFGQAAAPKLAPDKKAEIRTALPLATHEPVFADTKIPEREQPTPMFSSYVSHSSAQQKVGSKPFVIVVCLLVAGAAGFFGWQKYQPMQYLPQRAPRSVASGPATSPDVPESKPSALVPGTNAQTPTDTPSAASTPAVVLPQPATASPVPNNAPEGFPTKENIAVDDPGSDPVITVVPKPKPLQVNNKSFTASKLKTQPDQPAPPALNLPIASASDSALSGIVSTKAAMPKAATGTLQVSQGVTQGLLIKRVSPAYPMTALQMRKQGNVELLASISKTGAITGVKVISGDASLAKAAVDAVRQWKYRPYLLNGEPVEIQTQITVIFTLPR